MGNAILYRMPSGIPGDVSRLQSATIDTVPLNAAAAFSAYGLPGKLSAGKFIPLAGGEAPADVLGFLVRPYPIQTANADGSGVNSGMGNVMRRGYMTVKLNAGTAANGGKVYARVANASAGKPIGGIEAAAEWATATDTAGAGAEGANTGTGEITMDATTPVLAGAKVGVYKAVCTAAATNSGTFTVYDPDGYMLGTVAVGGTWANDIKFVIADGTSADFIVGDAFAITVTANTIAIDKCFFKAAADASGNVEIEFNI